MNMLKYNTNINEYLNLQKDFNFDFNSNFIFIDNINVFNKYKNDISKSKLLALDFEDICGYVKGQTIIPSLAQISSENKYVYIIDLLVKDLFDIFINFLIDILCDNNIIKIGLGLDDDFKILKKYANLDFYNNIIFRKIINVTDLFKEFYGLNYKGLEKICYHIYNKKLCKFEQTNDWDSRPLRKSQIHYSCLDTFILIDMYNIMLEKFSFDPIMFTDNYKFN